MFIETSPLSESSVNECTSITSGHIVLSGYDLAVWCTEKEDIQNRKFKYGARWLQKCKQYND